MARADEMSQMSDLMISCTNFVVLVRTSVTHVGLVRPGRGARSLLPTRRFLAPSSAT